MVLLCTVVSLVSFGISISYYVGGYKTDEDSRYKALICGTIWLISGYIWLYNLLGRLI